MPIGDIPITLEDDAIQPFASQVRDFAERGPRGIEYVVTRLRRDQPGVIERLPAVPGLPTDSEHIIESLLFRDKHGKVRGILHHHPMALPPFAVAGEIQICVDPRFYRKGIASRLLHEAMRRWSIDLARQRYTRSGATFICRFMRKA